MLIRKGVFTIAGVCALAFGSVSLAQEAGGLGQRWPNAADLSRTAGMHAYRFNQNGIAFVQVNGGDGTPQLGVAVANGFAVVLPIGDTTRVAVTDAATAASTPATIIYADDAVTIQATSTGYQVAPVSALGCGDPADCTRPPAAAAKSLSTMQAATCSDPADCTRIN